MRREQEELDISELTCAKVEGSGTVNRLHGEYLRTLVAPMDGMWESMTLSASTVWEIREGGYRVGYICVGSDNCLLRFFLREDSATQSEKLFSWIVSTFDITHAIAGTIEPQYFSACLDMQTRVTLHSYLFHDGVNVQAPPTLEDCTFKKADETEVVRFTEFYHAHTAGTGEWIDGFVRKCLTRGELFGLYEGQNVLAIGECIPSQSQAPYADLGVVVAEPHRGRGLGTSVLLHLKKHCYEAGWQPICSCAADNQASKRAIHKAGFVSEHRMVKMQLSADD